MIYGLHREGPSINEGGTRQKQPKDRISPDKRPFLTMGILPSTGSGSADEEGSPAADWLPPGPGPGLERPTVSTLLTVACIYPLKCQYVALICPLDFDYEPVFVRQVPDGLNHRPDLLLGAVGS